ncbi:MAG: BolA family protein [Thermoleophilia bacterium]
MDLNIVQELIETHLPGSRASVDDFMGAGGDHLAVRVEAEQFAGKSLIEQHKMIYAAVQEHLDSGAIHALSITTVPITPGASA